MKFFEYLAAGLPVVATAIDALGQFADASLLCPPDPEAFAVALEMALAGRGPDRTIRLTLAAEHTYAARTRRMLAELEEYA